ncbi:mechanosensitive ion channel protein 10 [Babesia caballi]|uniref:Mechanosensitive ion channel protein 10 n=1 Tax=Babesia caballi TaxID=5871 RepID=A0AAV4LXS2_BABCB|nr:mechanosensitive ion channel protein 10 [Babesia caballi]
MESSDNEEEVVGGARDVVFAPTSAGKTHTFVHDTYEEDEEEEDEPKRACVWFRNIIKTFFPDRQVPVWFGISAGIILVYGLFNFQNYTVDLDNKSNVSNYTINGIWCLNFILMGNMLMHLGAMVVRFVVISLLIKLHCSRNAYVFAMISMFDPAFFYVLWAATQGVVWQILVSRVKGTAGIFCIDVPFLPDFVTKRLIFREDTLTWISCAIHMHIILAIRCVALSIISFAFELNLLVNSNEVLKKYLKLYTNIRKFNIDWLSLVMSQPELVSKLKTAFARERYRDKIFPVIERSHLETGEFKNKHALQLLSGSHDTEYMQYFSTKQDLSVPSESADVMVEQSTTSAFSNWLLIYYVIRVPPVVSLLHQDITLKGNNMVSACATLLFEQMFATLTQLGSLTPDSGLDASPRHSILDDKVPCSAAPPSISGDSTVSASRSTVLITDVEPSNDGCRAKSCVLEQSIEAAATPRRKTDHISLKATPSYRVVERKSDVISQGAKMPKTTAWLRPSALKGRSKNHRAISVLNLQEFRSSFVDVAEREGGEAEDPANIVAPDYQFNSGKDDDTRFLSTEQMRTFLVPEECDTIMSLLDLSGHGKINISMMHQALQNLYSTRKKFKNNIKGQDSVFTVLSRLLSVATWLLSIVTMAFLGGITAEAIVVSGAALLSAITVALSYLYTNFMTSVIFVAFSNPYNVGDRVRLNDGEPLTVKKIKTYTTEFVTILGKVLVYQNAILSTMKITNESRAARATFSFEFKVGAKTTAEQLRGLEMHLATTCNARPNDFVKDSAIIYYTEFNPGHCINLCIWATCVESWGNWHRIFLLKSEVMEITLRYCRDSGIGYVMPAQPMTFPQQLSIRSVPKKDVHPAGKHP